MIDDHDECSGWMFLLVPAHPGCPGQFPQSRKTVVCVCVCVLRCTTPAIVYYAYCDVPVGVMLWKSCLIFLLKKRERFVQTSYFVHYTMMILRQFKGAKSADLFQNAVLRHFFTNRTFSCRSGFWNRWLSSNCVITQKHRSDKLRMNGNAKHPGEVC